MQNTYRVQENMIHISMNAGVLMKEGVMEVFDSNQLTDYIMELAQTFEENKAKEVEEDGDYFGRIDVFAMKELLKKFGNADYHHLQDTVHESTGLVTMEFFVNEDSFSDVLGTDSFMNQKFLGLAKHHAVMKRYSTDFKEFMYVDGLLTVVTKRK